MTVKTIYSQCLFHRLKSLLLRKEHHQRQNQGLLQKSRLQRYLELLTRINYSKMPFSSSKKKLLLRKQHHETTKPRLLLQKSSLERYLEFVNRITSKQVWKLRRLNLSYTSWSMHGKCYEVRLHLQLAIFYRYYPVFTTDCKLSTCNGYR